MYWCKTQKISCYFGVLLLIAGSTACNKPEIKETGAQIKYFDLKGYFAKEATKLTTLNPVVNKTVTHNGASESKNIAIKAWKQELNLFTESDINKPAWRNSYKVTLTPDSTVYTATEPDLKTRRISIVKNGGSISAVYILNSTHNFLYSTTDQLTYLPGKSYSIQKEQHVKIIGDNNYQIKGNFNDGR